MIKRFLLALAALLLISSGAWATNCPSFPFTLTNGTTADANQVMSNFNNLLTCSNTALAHNGANSDITSLSALSTPLSTAQGGTGVGSPGAAGSMLTSNGAAWQSVAPGVGLQADLSGNGQVGVSFNIIPQGRLSLSSGVPIQTADVAGAASIFYVPFKGNCYPWNNGTEWTIRCLAAQLTLALDSNAGHTGFQQSGKLFDLCLYNNGGTDTLVSGPAWSTNTARSQAFVLLNGIYVNSGSMTAKFDATASTLTIPGNECTYVGTMYASANGQTTTTMNPAPASGGSLPTLGIYNEYNKVLVRAHNTDNGVAYAYSSAAMRQARGSANNEVLLLSGFAEDSIEYTMSVRNVNTAAVSAFTVNGVGLDNTGALVGNGFLGQSAAAVTLTFAGVDTGTIDKQIGLHAISMNEQGDGTNGNSFDNTSANALFVQFMD